MVDAEVFERLNAWGIARDGDALDLQANLASTQAVVASTFEQARATLMGIAADFRGEAEALRQHSLYEAAQGLSRLEQVVAEARHRFDAQEASFTQHLGELVRRQQVVETWAQAEPARVAAIVQAAPAPWVQPQAVPFRASPGPQVVTSPGGTISFFPGGPPAGVVQPPVPAAGFTTPPRSAPQPNATPAWDTWAAGRGSPPPDAWAAAAAAPQQPQQQPGEQPRHSYMTPGGDGGRPREMRLDARGWGASQPKLDIGVPVDSFQIWKDRAMMFLSRERPDVRKLLSWAETQTKETLEDGLTAQAAHLGITDLAGVEYALHDGIKMTIMDTLLGRARNCIERGCELWRSLCAEWSGAAPQLQMAKARRYQDPPTCKNVQELWSRLPAWERLGEEVMLSGFVVPPWLHMTALEQLLPAPLRDALVARASCGDELKTFAARLAWVKVQMEHSRGLAQATAYAPGGGRGKDAAGDVNMYSVESPPGIGHDAVDSMSWALAEATQAGDWDLAAQLSDTIYAMKGGKGGFRKGLGKGKSGGKGGAAPAAAAKGGGAGTEFQGVCNHCNIWGHRRSECRKLTAELGKKGKAGGKGGPTGGKGPVAAPLAEVAAADGWAGDLLDGAIACAAAEFDEWNFDAAICSVTAAPFTAAASASSRLVQYKTFAVQPAPGQNCENPGIPPHAGQNRENPGIPPHAGQNCQNPGILPHDCGGAGAASASSRLVPAGHTQTSFYKPYPYIAAAVRPFSGTTAGETKQTRGAALPEEMRGPKPQKQVEFDRLDQRHRLMERQLRQRQQREQELQQQKVTPTQNSFDALSLLTDDAEELLAAVSGEAARTGDVVEAVVDSGAVHSVAPPGWFPGPTVPSPWSRAGRGYRAANGTGIKNLGQVAVKFCTAEGDRCSIPFQVAEVDQPLLSVAHLTQAGNRVELGHAGGRVVNVATGRTIALERRGGVYIMRMYLADGAAPAPFRRQGA